VPIVGGCAIIGPHARPALHFRFPARWHPDYAGLETAPDAAVEAFAKSLKEVFRPFKTDSTPNEAITEQEVIVKVLGLLERRAKGREAGPWRAARLMG